MRERTAVLTHYFLDKETKDYWGGRSKLEQERAHDDYKNTPARQRKESDGGFTPGSISAGNALPKRGGERKIRKKRREEREASSSRKTILAQSLTKIIERWRRRKRPSCL